MDIDLQTIISQLRSIQPQQFRTAQERKVIPSDQDVLPQDRVVYLREVYSAQLSPDITAKLEKKVDKTQQPTQETYRLEIWQSTTHIATYDGDKVMDLWNTIDKKVRLYENERFYVEHGGGD